MTYYKFKNVKHSVEMKMVSQDKDGNCVLEHTTYKGLLYKAHISNLEPVSQMTIGEVFGNNEEVILKRKGGKTNANEER